MRARRLTAMATPRLLLVRVCSTYGSECEERIVGVTLERIRSQPCAPAQRQRIALGIEPTGRRLVAGQDELDLEVELVVREKARQAAEGIVQRAARKKLFVALS